MPEICIILKNLYLFNNSESLYKCPYLFTLVILGFFYNYRQTMSIIKEKEVKPC